MFPRLTQFDLHHRLEDEQSPALVFFSADGCASCRHLKGILARLQQRHPEWRVYEVDAQSEMGLTREFEVFHLPAMFLFMKGKFHSEISCHASVQAVEESIARQLRQPPREAP